jgi:hypothetical protein
MKTAIVITSINKSKFLIRYCENLAKYNVDQDKVSIIVIGDEKTPSLSYIRQGNPYGYDVQYWDTESQELFSKALPTKLTYLVPPNSPRRRNMGYLFAIMGGYDNVIVMDDDNFPIGNWYKDHIDALYYRMKKAVRSENRIINPCRLVMPSNELCYSRGYPYNQYFLDTFYKTTHSNNRKCMLNMGLWTGKPDVDAIFNLIFPNYNCVDIDGFEDGYTASYNNYFPVNTQNTSYREELMPIFHNIYQEHVMDTPFERYDDIINGIFMLKLINHMGDTASFGTPVVSHERNSHNFSADLKTEIFGNMSGSELWRAIMNLQLESKTYTDGYIEIAKFLQTNKLFNSYEANKAYWRVGNSMFDWVELVEKYA